MASHRGNCLRILSLKMAVPERARWNKEVE
jgi:hypothetical protein